MIDDSTFMEIPSLHRKSFKKYIGSYKFEKKILNIYFNVCPLKIFIHNLLVP